MTHLPKCKLQEGRGSCLYGLRLDAQHLEPCLVHRVDLVFAKLQKESCWVRLMELQNSTFKDNTESEESLSGHTVDATYKDLWAIT